MADAVKTEPVATHVEATPQRSGLPSAVKWVAILKFP